MNNSALCYLYYACTGADIEVTLPFGSVTVDGLAKLTCTVTGVFAEVYNFTWLHNGEVQSERESPYTTITHDGLVSELSIHNIPSDEAGNYTCIAYISNTLILQDYYNLILQGQLQIYYACIHTYIYTYIHT